MIKKLVLYLLALNMMIAVAGCVSPMLQGSGPAGDKQNKGNVVELPERVIISRDDLPGDAELVMAAMINAIRGGKENIPNVGFDPAGTHQFLKDRFSYKGFDVKFIDIIDFKADKPLDGVRYTVLECGLYLADRVGRSAYVRILAEYAVTATDIIIANSEYELLPNPYPRIRTFILPRKVVDDAPAKVKHDFDRLLLLALQKAVRIEPTHEERIRHEQYDQLSFIGKLAYRTDVEPESYVVMAFCMERLRPESQFVLSVAKGEKVSGSLATPYYLNDNGWVVGIVGGKFRLDAYGQDTFFHVQFNPGIEPSNTELKHIGSFSTIKNYHIDRNKKSANPYLGAWKEQGIKTTAAVDTKGSISSGSVFLNPAAMEDAKKIQKRLADFGYYSMKIDGAFGKGSRGSLEAFKKANGLGNNSVWDIDTQKALFKGSGL